MPRSLAHRHRILLHTEPLHALRDGESHVAKEQRHYDTLELAVTVFDLIIDRMGLENEVDREALGAALAAMLAGMDRAHGMEPDPARHEAVLDRVIAGLRNDANRRQPFAYPYGDFDADRGEWCQRRVEFRLVSDHFHASGRMVLRLSTEAVNLYLGALELEIEDAQAATEAVIQSQIARGRLDEASESARQANWQSLRYLEKMRRLLRDTRRDVTSVDWRLEVPRLLEEALQHVKGRLDVEDGIVKAARERLDVIEDVTKSDSEARRLRLAEILALVGDCAVRHVQLHGELMGARELFLREQVRQRFVPAPGRFRPDLPTDVLEPLLAMGRDAAASVVDEGLPALLGAHPKGVLSLRQLVLWQLRPRKVVAPGAIAETAASLGPRPDELLRFPAAIRAEAQARVQDLDQTTTLSRLLADAEPTGPALQEAIALTALASFAPEKQAAIKVRRAGRPLEIHGFFGDDLELEPADAA